MAERLNIALVKQWRALAEQPFEAEEYGDDELVHHFRLRIKRMRAMLQLLRLQLPRGVRIELDNGLRDIGRKLSDIRMASVLENCEQSLPGETLDKNIEAVARDTSTLRAALALELKQYSDALEAHIPPHFSICELCEGLVGIYRRARRRFKSWQITADYTDAHECRKYTKYLMYAIDYSSPWLKGKRLMRRRLGLLEDALGNMNDLVEFEARRSNIDVSSEISAYADTAVGLCESIYSVKPKKFMRYCLSSCSITT